MAVAVAIVPLVEATAGHTPTGGELRRAFTHYAGQIDVFSEHSYRLAPEVFGRGGAVAIAGLLLIPLAALASRRRWAAFVLGEQLNAIQLIGGAIVLTSVGAVVASAQPQAGEELAESAAETDAP